MKKCVLIILALMLTLSVLTSCDTGKQPGVDTKTEPDTPNDTVYEAETDVITERMTDAETEEETEEEEEEEEEYETEPEIEISGEVLFSFAVMTDTHIGDKNTTESLERLMKYLSSFDKAPEAYMHAGDVTNGMGTQKDTAQIDTFKSIYEKYSTPDRFFYCMGPTHDTPEQDDGREYRVLFEQTMGDAYYTDTLEPYEMTESGLRHKVFGGYHFFTVDWDGANDGRPTAAQQAYLDEELAALTAEDPDKPVFVITHMTTSALNNVLKRYPQTICFRGHLHNSIAREDNIDQDLGFTIVYAGGVDYYRVDGYNRYNKDEFLELGDKYAFAQGLYVQIDSANHVHITRVDGYNGTTIGRKWVVGTDLERKYTSDRKSDYRKCSFARSDAQITATDTALSVSFDACRSGEAGPAIYYSVKLLRKNADGQYEVTETKDMSSRQVFFPNDVGVPDLYYTVIFVDPDGFGDYAVCISAFDCFGESENAIVYSKLGDYTADLPAVGRVKYTFREMTEEEKQVGLVTEGEQTVTFDYDGQSTTIFSKNTTMAVRFHPSYRFKDVMIRCTSNGDTVGTLEFNLYKWTGDYMETIGTEPVDTFTLTGFKGSTAYVVTNEEHEAGEYLLLITTPDYTEGVGVYHYKLADGQEKAYVSYNTRRAMKTYIYLTWVNLAVCEHPYIVCK
ncbi:MAG: metallophosphoesterase [Clostridia bacterium]|nr:metallophosphoesterase [Clostridia bacterium]